jgi:hypothetical protein
MNVTIVTAVTFALIAASATQASAVSRAVKMACIGDYLSYCSAYSPSSAEVRSCFRANGPKLSSSCVKALVKHGYVSQAEVNRRAASIGR